MAHIGTNENAQAAAPSLPKPDVLSPDCPSRAILQHVTSRWGTLVLIVLDAKVLRFSDLKRRIGGVSDRMLAQTLQVLEADGLILRHAFDVVPPHVEYRLTPLGAEVSNRVVSLASLIEANLPQFLSKRPKRPAAPQTVR